MILIAISLSISSGMFGQSLPTSTETASAMTIGWNLGNTLEATGGETAWGNPVTTQQLINAVKAAGFNTVRLPCAWDGHADQTTHVIDANWIARVKEVVDYCINNNMYVILNIHWDGGWLENNVTTSAQSLVNEKQQTYWTQIANYFKNYDGHLLFASANEPDVSDATGMSVLLSYHQTFINAVRATGGNNSSRVLIIQGPATDIEKTNNLMNTMPTDQIADRLMVEIHYYTPWNFCGMTEDASWGNMFYYWGEDYHSTTDTDHNATWGEESDLENYFQMMKTKFVDNGIPVIMGEFGAIKRTSLTGSDLTLHIASREYYYKFIADAAKRYGLVPVYWDNGVSGNNGFALFDRSTGAIVDQGAVDALMEGIGGGCTPTAITPYIQVDGGSWQQTSSVTVNSGSTVKFGPQPTSGGSWSWIGCSTSGTSREQTFTAGSSCTATATYTNSSGCQSTQNFTVTVNSGNIIVRARGTDGSESVSIQVNGSTVATYTLSTSYGDYSASGSGTVRVAFTNDASGRDVQVDYITIDGTTYQAEDQSVNTGVWQNSQCGGSYSEWLHCNGYIEFSGGSYPIVVRAKGANGSENIQLTVGGTQVSSWTLSTSMTDYSASTSLSGTINVEFTNDNGSGRDVQVDYINVNGTTYQAEDQATNTGVWQNSQCGGSYSEWLHCNGYIEFGTFKVSEVNIDESVVENNNEISVYPNPVNDILTISLPESIDKTEVSLYNSSSCFVRSIILGNATTDIDLSNLKSGLYILKLNYNNEIVTRKFIKE